MTQADQQPIEAENEKAPEGRIEESSLDVSRPPTVPDLSRTQLGYLRSVLVLPGE